MEQYVSKPTIDATRQPHLRLALALILIISLAVGLGAGLTACGSPADGDGDGGAGAATAPESVRVASLRGPTSIGLVGMMEQAETADPDSAYGLYDFTIYGTADEIVPQLVSGDIDIALVPANIAAVLYNRTEGGIVAIDINTLGVLYVVSADASINSLADLEGRTVMMTGKGTTPEYVMNYLLEKAGLAGKVNLEYRSEATDLAAAVNADADAVALLPEPYVTAVCTKNPDLAPRISLTDAWRQTQGGSQLVTGVTVVRSEFLAEYPEAVALFLAHHQASVRLATTSPAEAAGLVVKFGIIDDAAIAEQAIPRCYLVCLTGDEMRMALSMYLDVLYQADPAAVGGALPDEGFYLPAT
jgi:NitT/TauT family transport system substrate-binding protein